MNHFMSMSQLVKQSARQIKRKRDEPKQSVDPNAEIFFPMTKGVIAGQEFADQNTVSPYVEMQAFYNYKSEYLKDTLSICFSVDEIRKKIRTFHLIEHKNCDERKEEWYFESSLLQTALMASLANKVKLYRTAKYHCGPKHELLINKPIVNLLNFGGDYYWVKVKDTSVLNFYIRKAYCTLTWEEANLWDHSYKRREFYTLGHTFEYGKYGKHNL